MELKETIKKLKNELDGDSLNKQRKRYLEGYLQELDMYLDKHPDATELPTPFELFCDLNPHAPECRIYNV